ncbi:MAG: cytochrome P450 [Leptolyngbyaceae cyanobacterium MO_188.B28]|nr:cytochrome P450 [Leptolyngbyaceae cyanobacterium MO_188.B28]
MTLPNGPRTPKYFRFFRLLKLVFRPLAYLENYAQRYGDIVKIGGDNSPPFVYISNPQAIKEIFTADPNLFESGRGNGVLRFLLGDRSLILLDSEPHQQQRRLLTPPFHGDRLRTYSQLICDITEKVTHSWTIGAPFLLRPQMQDITMQVILQAVFGLYEGERLQQLQKCVSALMDSFGSPLSSTLVFFRFLQKDWGPLSPWGRLLRLKQRVRELIYAEIRDRRAEMQTSQNSPSNRTDILSLLMLARDEAGQSMTDEELHDQLMTLLIAGHESTASALVWALYWVHYLPEVQQTLRQELDDLGERPNPKDIVQLPYLTAVCQETLRIYPVVPSTFIRVLKTPMSLLNYQFEAGTALLPSTYLVHQRPDLYPDPKRFDPKRFLEKQYAPYEYFPFGGGGRRCIGSALAQLEMKLALAIILKHCHLELTHNHPVKPVRRGFTFAPPGNLRMVVTQKS